jgi:multicomponent Na+:H+ antiporter subunit D
MLAALSLITVQGTAGWLLYMLGHGMVKACLFMAAGMLAAVLDSVDELELYGRARGRPVLACCFFVAGLCLAGFPIGIMGSGAEAVEGAAKLAGDDWLGPIIIISSATTGGAVLRAGIRIFLGKGELPAGKSPLPKESERGDRPWLLMLLPALVLVFANVGAAMPLERMARAAAATFVHMPAWDVLSAKQAYATPAMPPAASAGEFSGWLAVGIALVIAAAQLFLAGLLKNRLWWPAQVSIRALRALHAGCVGDQLAWLAAGLAMLTAGIAAVSVLQ